ncbi:VOC family protein [Deinococcus lacus]|uniref:VOC family protein n=1 Tax=Deinococcus lacus TaxID=392561 RepID=A0ABW1Y8X8_9DEIO
MTLRLELFVQDVARSVAFYRDVLGFVDTGGAQSTYRPLRLKDVRIAVHDSRTLEPGHPLAWPGRRGLGIELVLEVPDVCATHAQAARHAEVTPLHRQPWGLTDFRVTDPDGYYWRVTEARVMLP